MRVLTLALSLLLFGCSASTPPTDANAASSSAPPAAAPVAPEPAQTTIADATKKQEIDYSCQTAADCEVKDVGNCCGYYPACVNKDSPTFPEQVKADCEKGGLMGVCGFANIASCECVENRCTGVTGPEAAAQSSM